MAKSPVPGRVKTRLMPELSASDAAGIAALLIRETARLAANTWPGPIHLLCWPDQKSSIFREIADSTRIRLAVQSTGGLGERMNTALCGFTSQGVPAAVIGCDVPHCPSDQLHLAYTLLSEGQNVIGPSLDGGYYFLGLQLCHPGLFSGIRWGESDVLQMTMKRASELGIEFAALSTVRDIDDYGDLVAAASVIPSLQHVLDSGLS